MPSRPGCGLSDERPRSTNVKGACFRCGARVIAAFPDGRKLFANSALLGSEGNILAIAQATWLLVDRRELGQT
jgi:hypothetical protein